MKLSLKNIGPFHECDLNISDVTVIAGINDTGKSYLNKILFSVLKILCINIESDLLENFLKSSKNFSFNLKVAVEDFAEDFEKVNFQKNEKNSLFFSSLKELIIKLKSFESYVTTNKFNLKELLKNYLMFLNDNQAEINKIIKELVLFENKKNLQHLNERLNWINDNFEKIKLELDLILKKDESYIYSLLSNNIFNENFNESIKNKNYLEQNSNLILSSKNFEILNSTISNNNEIKVKLDKNLNSYNDITYISDTFKIFEKIINQQRMIKNNELESFYFHHLLFNNNVSNVFKFKNSNFSSDFNSKISIKDEKSLNELFFKDEIKSKFQNYFSLNQKINKTNDAFINEKGVNIKFSNASKGLKIIEAFNQLIDTTIFAQNNILILDEPEAFLHPEWQYLFIKWLLDVSTSIKNFKLIISTHSPYIVDMIESFSTRQFKKLKFSYNFLTKDQNQDSIIENEEHPEKINAVLNGPFMKLENEEYEWDNKK